MSRLHDLLTFAHLRRWVRRGGRVPTPPEEESSALPLGTGQRLVGELFPRSRLRNLWWVGKTIPLDGYDFVNCRFDDCTLVYHGSDWSLVECFLDPATRIEHRSLPPEMAARRDALVDALVEGDRARVDALLAEAGSMSDISPSRTST